MILSTLKTDPHVLSRFISFIRQSISNSICSSSICLLSIANRAARETDLIFIWGVSWQGWLSLELPTVRS